MSILLDTDEIPEKGKVQLKIDRSFEIKVTAETARRTVNRWLIDEVSSLLGADLPTLVVGEQIVWRVPVWISFPHTGRASVVGVVDIDIETGRMNDSPACKEAIERQAQTLAAKQPPYHLHEAPAHYLAQNFPSVPSVYTLDDGTLTVTAPSEEG